MNDDDGNKGLPKGVAVGQDISACSLEELQKRITVLRSEIARHETEIASKQSSKVAAESFFNQE